MLKLVKFLKECSLNMEFKIPFSGRSHRFLKNEIKLVSRIMSSTVNLTQGSYQIKFENDFKKFLKNKNSRCFAVSSATSAIEIVSQLCNFNKNDEIIIPSHTYTSSAYPFLKTNAKIKWADIDFKTRVVSLNNIKKKITKKTKAVMVVHLYGYAANVDEIRDFCKLKKILLIEDVAQAIGTKIRNKMTGTFGDFSIFSFHSHKNMTTLGEGGMLVVNNSNYKNNLIKMIRHNGHTSFKYKRKDYWIPAMGNVDAPYLENNLIIPNNFSITEIQCAVGSELLKRIDDINFTKRKRAIYTIDSLKKIKELEFLRVNNQRHNYHLLVCSIKKNKFFNRDDFIRKMSKEYKIQCIVQYYPLHLYDLYKKIMKKTYTLEETEKFFNSMVSFPFSSHLTNSDLKYIINSTKKTINSFKS